MKNLLISEFISLKESLKVMDNASSKVLFVINDMNELIGTVSDGDIRRAILKGSKLSAPVQKFMNHRPICASRDEDIDHLKNLMIVNEIQSIPIIDANNTITEIVHWHKLFAKEAKTYKNLNIPVVVMAGGIGTRLEPFTKILPKPLVPIGEKTILEIILEEYDKYGVKDIYLTLNYRANMIKAYFEYCEKRYNINYVEETKPLGTAGALKLITEKIKTPFFVSNCDIIIHEDYSKIYDFHSNGHFDLTLVASVHHHIVPYGVCEIENGGKLKSINEKPEYDFLVNTGMYILNPTVLEFIPEDRFFHITHLITELQKYGKKIGVFPVSEKSWVDVGQWGEYQKSLEFFKNFT